MKRIFIDAGHGMGNVKSGRYDSGAVAGGKTEAGICLDIALAGKFILSGLGHKVALSRYTHDDNAPLSGRIRKAVDFDADLWISVHLNSGPVSANGAEVLFRNHKQYAGKCLDAAVTAIKPYRPGFKNRGVKSEGSGHHPRLFVLGAPMPCCLIELGFISNPDDLKALTLRDFRIDLWQHYAEKVLK